MSKLDNNTIAGKIEIREGKRGAEVYARSRARPIGTIIGAVYEKVTAILYSPEPSISMTQAEYTAVVDSGAVYLRCIPSDKSATYSISLADFKANSEPYQNNQYGSQLRVPLSAFQSSRAVAPRNSLVDNPKPTRNVPIIRQLPMFGGER